MTSAPLTPPTNSAAATPAQAPTTSRAPRVGHRKEA